MIVLDTGAWLWWVGDPARLSPRARRAIERGERGDGLMVSAISVWEVTLKQSLGKLELDRDVRAWIARAVTYPGIHLAPVGSEDAVESVLLPGEFHRDPADRFIVALARRLGARLVTSDRKILAYPHVKTVW